MLPPPQTPVPVTFMANQLHAKADVKTLSDMFRVHRLHLTSSQRELRPYVILMYVGSVRTIPCSKAETNILQWLSIVVPNFVNRTIAVQLRKQ